MTRLLALAAALVALPASAQGTVTVSAGTLTLGSGARLSTPLSVTVAAGAALATGAPATGGTLALTGMADQTVTAATLGNLAFAKTGGNVVLGSDLAVTGVLTAGGGTLVPGAFTLRLAPTVANGQITRLAALAGDGASLGGAVTFERPHLDGAGFRMIAAPLQSTFQSLNDDFLTQGATGARFSFGQPNVNAWDPARPAAQRYVPVTDFTQPMTAGRGYFLQAFAADPDGAALLPTTWDVTGTEAPDAVAVPLVYSAADADAPFNLLGNPYAAPLDWHAVQAAGSFTAAYAVWDPAANGGAGNYAYYSTAGVSTGDASRYLPVAQGFWAEATAQSPAALAFRRAWKAPTAAPVTVGRGTAEATAVAQLRVHLEGRGLTATEPVALFLDGGADGADLYDATWLSPLAAESAAATFVRADDGRALVFEGRAVDTQAPLRLAVQTTRAGRYTLSWPDLAAAPDGPLTLLDLQTGERVDLRASASYAFDLAAADTPGAPRFEVVVGARATVGGEAPAAADLTLAPVRPNPASGTARVRFELPEAGPARVTVIDLLGRTVAVVADEAFAAGPHEVSVDASRLPAGVYVVRLLAAGRVRTTRLTVAR